MALSQKIGSCAVLELQPLVLQEHLVVVFLLQTNAKIDPRFYPANTQSCKCELVDRLKKVRGSIPSAQCFVFLFGFGQEF